MLTYNIHACIFNPFVPSKLFTHRNYSFLKNYIHIHLPLHFHISSLRYHYDDTSCMHTYSRKTCKQPPLHNILICNFLFETLKATWVIQRALFEQLRRSGNISELIKNSFLSLSISKKKKMIAYIHDFRQEGKKEE